MPTLMIFGDSAMAITTFSSREFNQSASEAKSAANLGPVFITDRGRPAHVIMSIELYQQITGNRQKIADLLAMPGIVDIDIEIPRSAGLPRAADLS